jgi:hypothetical protein
MWWSTGLNECPEGKLIRRRDVPRFSHFIVQSPISAVIYVMVVALIITLA